MTTSIKEFSNICLTFLPNRGSVDRNENRYWVETSKPSQMTMMIIMIVVIIIVTTYWTYVICQVCEFCRFCCFTFTGIQRVEYHVSTHLKMSKLRRMEVEYHVENPMVVERELDSRLIWSSDLSAAVLVLAHKSHNPGHMSVLEKSGHPIEAQTVLGRSSLKVH